MDVASIKKKYPVDTRIKLINMDDPWNPVEPGTEGTVKLVDDIGQIHMKWDNGRTLPLVPGQDDFEIINK